MIDENTPVNLEGVRVYLHEQYAAEALRAQATEEQHTLTLESAKHVDDFIYILDKIIKHDEQINNTGVTTTITMEYPETDAFQKMFDPDAPQNEVGTQYGDVIQYRLISRRPSVFQATNKPMAPGATRGYVPTLRYSVPDPENKGYIYRVDGQYFDNYIELVIWSKTSKQANAKALWLEDLVQRYRHVILSSGYVHFRYEGRDEDRIYINSSKTVRLAGRPLTFYIRNEKIIVSRQKTIEDLMVNVNILV